MPSTESQLNALKNFSKATANNEQIEFWKEFTKIDKVPYEIFVGPREEKGFREFLLDNGIWHRIEIEDFGE